MSQARFPVGKAILELPAGMLDDDAGDYLGTAAKEVFTHTQAIDVVLGILSESVSSWTLLLVVSVYVGCVVQILHAHLWIYITTRTPL